LKLLFLALMAGLARAAEPPVQPVPYSHKQHIALGLKCKDCHTNPDPGEVMGIPASSRCMACHATIKPVQKLTASVRDKKPIDWVRVYQIPSYVYFNHRTHLESGAQCETCHGKVSERDRLFREGDISMGGCMKCHQANKASIACNYCHEQPN
jgi:Class III cytochrome C family.